MKNLQINQTPIGQQDYNLVEKVSDDINVFSPIQLPDGAIDLGLPSGILWADKNIGATTPEEAGLYFQWGDTQGYTVEQMGNGEGQKYFTWADYKFSVDGSDTNFSKYNSSDGKTSLDLEDDAAHVVMSGNWRMPTLLDFRELCMNTDVYLVPAEGEEILGTAQVQTGNTTVINWASTVSGDLKCVKFYKKNDHSTYISIPVSGFAQEGWQGSYGGPNGHIWLSNLDTSEIQYGGSFYFVPDFGFAFTDDRYKGKPIRGIINNNA